MKTLLNALTATIAVCLLPSASQATCVANGTIPRVNVQANPTATNIGVAENGPGSTFFNFTTTSAAFINTAVVAGSSHISVEVTGNAASCGAPVNGVSAGGTVISILVSP